MIILDYETRSEANLPEVGAYNYARHESTDILCLAMYDTDTDEKIVFDPCEESMPQNWRDKLNCEDTLVGAVNATFDREIHSYVGVKEYKFPAVAFERWYCISAQLRVNAMPANLEDAAQAAKVANLKDPRGKQLIKLLSIPDENGDFNEDPALMQEMKDYCMKDVLASVDLFRCTRQMTETEHKDWLICEAMNSKGVKIDRKLANAATMYASLEQSDVAKQLEIATKGEITKPTQIQRIKKYVLDAIQNSNDENDRRMLKLMTTYKNKVKKYSLDKDVRESLITAFDEGTIVPYEDIEQVVRLLDLASASSVAKFARMKDLASPIDDRVRGAFIHAGASQTHRFSSKGLQLHNMKRKCFSPEDAEKIINKMERGQTLPSVMQTLAMMLRPAVIPADGHKFIVGDWSAIEARALPWLTADPRAERKLDQFRNGVDTYIEAAKGIFNKTEIDPESDDRQVGKVSELSLGYGGAAGAFTAMAKNYGVFLPDHMVDRIVKQWRKTNPWAVQYWKDLETAAKRAIRHRGSKSFPVGRVTYHFIPQMLGGTLVCELPDGTFIQYPYARIEHTDKGDGIVALKAGIKPKQGSKDHWGAVRLWGGLFAENNTQAICAALLRNAIRSLDWMKYFLVAHVHDELILEVPLRDVDDAKYDLEEVMATPPVWAEGLPLKAEPVILSRYGNH